MFFIKFLINLVIRCNYKIVVYCHMYYDVFSLCMF